MLSCREAIAELWDYLDGELPAERAEAIAGHLSECGRCYPKYRFAYAFLAALARQGAHLPKPTSTLVQRIGALVRGQVAGAPADVSAGGKAAVEPRRATPRAAPPLVPRGAGLMALGARAGAERWAFALLRITLGAFLALGVGRLIAMAGTVAMPPRVLHALAGVEGVLATFVVLGAWRRWSYGAALAVHVGALLLLWGQLRDPWGAAVAGLPACGALVTLYLLRDRDAWTVDAWRLTRRLSRATS